MSINSSERESIATGKTYTEKRAEKYLREEKRNKKPYKSKYKTKKQSKSKYKKSSKSKDSTLTKLFGTILKFLKIEKKTKKKRYKRYKPYKKSYKYYNKHKRYQKPSKTKKNDKSWVIGLEGENLVLEQLNKLPKNYFVFHDVKMPKGRGNIDHIVVGPTGLFVIETKNYSGKYQIKGNKWYYYKDGKFNKMDKNPGNQLIRNIMDLKSFLNAKGIKSEIYANGIIAFVQNNYSITQEPKNYKVFSPAMIPQYIISKQKSSDLKTLAKIAEEIEPYCTELTYVPK